MSQNRNKLLQLLIGNLVNVIVHKVLEEAVKEDILRNHYDKESLVSFEVAKKYREKINPVQRELPENDINKIREEVLKRVDKELKLRVSKGYQGINLSLVKEILEKTLKELKI
jgi:hypothetical protein